MSRKNEVTTDEKVESLGTVTLPDIEEEFEPSPLVIAAREKEFRKDQYARLQFAEEPVTIRFDTQAGDFAPTVVDCWVNGKGAEMLQDGQWVEYGAFPIGYEIVTKRKYVEVLARAKKISIKTKITDKNGDNPINTVERFPSVSVPFSIITFGPNESIGREWAKRIMSHA